MSIAVHENLAARLLDTALERGWGERIALMQGSRAWTFGQLTEHVRRVDTVIRELGIAPGDHVAVLMRDSLEAAGALLGIIHAGAVAVPLSELARPLDIRECLIHSQAVAVVVHKTLEPALDEISAGVPSLRHILCVGQTERAGLHDYQALLSAAEPCVQAAAVSPRDKALLLYSTMGVERELLGIPHSHDTPLQAYESFARGVIGLNENDRVFSLGRLYTTYGLGCSLFFPLAAGCQTYLLTEQPHSETVFEVVDSFDPTVFFATPSIFGQLARDTEQQGREPPLARCRMCISGAEGMPPKLVPKIRHVLGTEVVVGYGLTEAFQFVFVGRAADLPLGSAGKPIAGFETRIVDDHGVPMGANNIGTLEIRGPTVLDAYWGVCEPDTPFHDGWFITRDRFMMDDQGNHFHCGRVDELFKVGGKWVSPLEVERALMAHEAVWDCAVIGADDEDGLLKPFAFVVPNIGHEPGPELERELRAYVKNALAPYKYPRWMEFRERLPKGPTGKVLRYKLKPTLEQRRAESVPDEP